MTSRQWCWIGGGEGIEGTRRRKWEIWDIGNGGNSKQGKTKKLHTEKRKYERDLNFHN